ncbi:MAG TPA: hypothetical protein PKW49_10655 [Paludibacteraceae bacterium]|nr:hypothetical protein [Paludibacteraceae bacterium]
MSALTTFKEAFVPRYQDILGKTMVGFVVGNTRLQSQLTEGKTVSRSIADFSDIYVRDVTRYTDRTINGVGDSNEQLTIDKQKSADFKLDSWDKLQNGPRKIGELAAKECTLKLRRYMDADILGQTLNAFDTFDDGDIGGTAGNGIALSTTNFAQVFSDLGAKLAANDVEDNGDLVLVTDPYVLSIANQTLLGKNIEMTGTTFKNGYSGPIVGFRTYRSNNLTFTASLSLAQDVTATDTVSIGGVVFKFVSSLSSGPAVAGEVLAGANAAASRANLIAAINNAAGAGTTYTEVSDADRKKLIGWRVVASASGTSVNLVCTGSGRLSVTETLTHASNVWSKKMIHCYAGRKKGVDMVIQSDINPDPRPEPRQKTVNFLIDALYGYKTFADGARTFLDFQIAIS